MISTSTTPRRGDRGERRYRHRGDVDYTLPANVEASCSARLTGTGTNGADTLLSSGGPNTLVGLGGDDLYYVNNTGDVVIEAANGGYDTVMASVSYTLPANVEALYVTGSGLTGTGNSSANTLVTIGANTLIGGDGNDTFVFFAGSANGATVTDFNRDQVGEWDFLVFSGFGTEAQGATFTPDRHHRPVADPFRPRCPQRDDHALEPRRAAMPGISSSCEARDGIAGNAHSPRSATRGSASSARC